jgi:hypothetical protein
MQTGIGRPPDREVRGAETSWRIGPDREERAAWRRRARRRGVRRERPRRARAPVATAAAIAREGATRVAQALAWALGGMPTHDA